LKAVFGIVMVIARGISKNFAFDYLNPFPFSKRASLCTQVFE
jgi:hypothetical protein